MMTVVLLHGELGKRFGRRYRFDIATPAEAVNAMECARPGFKLALIELHSHVVRLKGHSIGEQRLQLPANGRTVSFTPVIEGAVSGKAIGQIILGVVLVAAAVVSLGSTSGFLGAYALQVGLLGAALVLGGIAQLLSPSPQSEKQKKNKGSYIFQNVVNSMEQGGPVPLAYGNPTIGGNVISVDMYAQDIMQGSASSPDPADNTGSSMTGDPTQPARPAGSGTNTIIEP